MLILSIKTDQPEAQLALYDDETLVSEEIWQAHRQLAETIHTKIKQLLESNGKNLQDLHGIICFRGPGSFTGLRIGLSVANALAYSLNIPVASAAGEKWAENGVKALVSGKGEGIVLPEYGAPVHITQQKK